MPITQKELARRFARGDAPSEIPDASNVSVTEATTDTAEAWVVGYGWAIYAVRRPDGTVILCNGWRGYSASTTCQMTELGKGFLAAFGEAYDARVIESESAPQMDDPPASTDLIGTTPAR